MRRANVMTAFLFVVSAGTVYSDGLPSAPTLRFQGLGESGLEQIEQTLNFRGIGDQELPENAALGFKGLGDAGLPDAVNLAFRGDPIRSPAVIKGAVLFRGLASQPLMLKGNLSFRGLNGMAGRIYGELSFAGWSLDDQIAQIIAEIRTYSCGDGQRVDEKDISSFAAHEGRTFRRYDDALPYTAAVSACKAHGGQLVTFADAQTCAALRPIMAGCRGEGCYVGFEGNFKDGFKWLDGRTVGDEVQWTRQAALLGNAGRSGTTGYGVTKWEGLFATAFDGPASSSNWDVGGYICQTDVTFETIVGKWFTQIGEISIFADTDLPDPSLHLAFQAGHYNSGFIKELGFDVDRFRATIGVQYVHTPTISQLRWDGANLVTEVAMPTVLAEDCPQSMPGDSSTKRWVRLRFTTHDYPDANDPSPFMRPVFEPCGVIEASPQTLTLSFLNRNGNPYGFLNP